MKFSIQSFVIYLYGSKKSKVYEQRCSLFYVLFSVIPRRRNYPEENTHTEHGESLISRKMCLCISWRMWERSFSSIHSGCTWPPMPYVCKC